MKLNILLATGMVLMAGCNPTENAAGPQPAANTAFEAAAPAAPEQPNPSTQAKHAAPLGTEEYPSIQRGSTLSAAGPSGAMGPLLVSGWSTMEDWGVWSDGTHARIGFKLDEPVEQDAQVTLLLKAFLTGDKTELVVVPTANGRKLPAITFKGDQAAAKPYVITVNSSDIVKANGRVQLDFDIRDPRSPTEMGMPADARKLGIAVIDMTVQ